MILKYILVGIIYLYTGATLQVIDVSSFEPPFHTKFILGGESHACTFLEELTNSETWHEKPRKSQAS